MNKNTLVVGFMLFAAFFGAGNLIFPPKLGFDSGLDFWTSIAGFILTGVGLPLLTTIVAACYEGGYKKALDNISPIISVLLLSAIYLTIGPFFAIPRTGATAYDIAIIPFLSEPNALSLLIFTTIYFAITLWLSLNPNKMVDRIGAILTPLLLLSIIALVIKAVMLYSGTETVTTKTQEAPFLTGFIEGYNTMDVLAAVAFSVLVINGIKAKSDAQGNALIKQTAIASMIAAAALALIYISIAWIGYKIPMSEDTAANVIAEGQNLGTFILNTTANQAFGELGRTLLGIIVTLACLTTSIGLVVSTAAYFNSIFPKISYKTYVVIFVLIGFGLANQGLNAVISKSVPVLLILYPITMTTLLLLTTNYFIVKLPVLTQRLSMILVTLVSIASVAGLPFTESLPLKSFSMEWILFALAGLIVGFAIEKVKK